MKISSLPVLFQGDIYLASPVNIQLLKGSIQQSNGDGVALQAVARMTELRAQCENITSNSLDSLLEYDCLLTHLSRALLGASLPFEFKWKIPVIRKKTGLLASITGDATEVVLEEQSSPSINFERVHVLFNAGLISFRTATSLANSTSTIADSIKPFTNAAGIFVTCVELADKCGLQKQAEDGRLLEILSRGYAQLAFYVKSVNSNSSINLRSKIAGGAVEILKNGTKLMANFSLIVAHCAAAAVCEENLEFGEALSHYKESLKIIKELNSSKFDVIAKEIKFVFENLNKDNENIYMKQIPDVPPQLQSRIVVNDTAYELKEEDSPFKSIVPFALRGPLQRYQRESGKIVNDTKSMIPQFTAQGDSLIQGINLRELENRVESLSGIPNNLKVVLSRIRGVNSIEEVIKQLEQINERNKKIRNDVEDINDELKNENDENERYSKKYREHWERQSSFVVGREFYSEVERINRFIEQSKLIYMDSKSVILKSETKIKILEKGEEELSSTLPKNSGNILKEIVSKMTELFENWNEIKVQREKAVNEIIELQSKHQKSLLEELKQAVDKNVYIDSLVNEFGTYTSAIQKTLNQQSELMTQVTSLNNELIQYSATISDSKSAVCEEYAQIGEKYISISLQIVELLVKLETVEEDLDKLKRNTKRYCDMRKQEIPEVEQRADERIKKIEQDRLRAEDERKRIEQERIKAEQERKRIEQERLKAEQERIKAEEERRKKELEMHQQRYPSSSTTNYNQPQYPSTYGYPNQQNNQPQYPSAYGHPNQQTNQPQYPSSYAPAQPKPSYPSSYSPSTQPPTTTTTQYPQNYPPSHQSRPSYPSSYTTSAPAQPIPGNAPQYSGPYGSIQTQPPPNVPPSKPNYPSSYATSSLTQPPPTQPQNIPQYQSPNRFSPYPSAVPTTGTNPPPVGPGYSSPSLTSSSRGMAPGYPSSTMGGNPYGNVAPPYGVTPSYPVNPPPYGVNQPPYGGSSGYPPTNQPPYGMGNPF